MIKTEDIRMINLEYADDMMKNFIIKYLTIFSLIILERMFDGSFSRTWIEEDNIRWVPFKDMKSVGRKRTETK